MKEKHKINPPKLKNIKKKKIQKLCSYTKKKKKLENKSK